MEENNVNNKQLEKIAEILDNHFNPPKKSNKAQIALYLLAGTAAIWALDKFYGMILPLFNFNIPM